MSVQLFRLVLIIGICATGIAIVAYCIGKSKGYFECYDRGYSLTRFTAKQAREINDIVERNELNATLGSDNCTNGERTETCRIRVQDNLAETEGMGDIWLECDACGWQMPLEPSTPRFNYCPNCGRKVVNE